MPSATSATALSARHALTASKWRIVDRQHCQFLMLELPPGLSRQQAENAIALQLQRLDGRPHLEFAWAAPESAQRQYRIWYWDNPLIQAQTCPEPLLREAVATDGPRLVALPNGYDLIYQQALQTRKTRWMAALPDDKQWAQWCEECGVADATGKAPAAIELAQRKRPEPGWRYRRLPQSSAWSAQRLRQLALLGLLGMATGLAAGLPLVLNYQIDQLQGTLTAMRTEAGARAVQQRELQTILADIEPIAAQVPAITQLELLSRLSEAKILGGQGQPILSEWDVQKNRLRMQIIRPAGEFSLDEFLQSLEAAAMLQDIRLMPNPPAGTLVIQAQIKT